MKYLRIKLIVLLLCVVATSFADDFPWKKYGLNPKVLTLSKGKYKEFHDMETVVQIGSVYFNTETRKIVGFVKKDTTSKVLSMDAHTVSRWFSPDPLSEEYSSWSPYNYVMNNPVMFIDPDGREVWIYYRDADNKEQKIQYSKGMKYDGDNTFVSSTIDYLNAMGDSGAGTQVLTTLIGSKNTFDFTNTASAGGPGTLQFDFISNKEKYKNGGAEIHAAELAGSSMNSEQKMEATAHEVFHGYQREMGENPATINAEVGAYIFGRGVAGTSKYAPCGIAPFGNGSKAGNTYHSAMRNMVYGMDSNHKKNLKTAINNFLKGSIVNNDGLYNKSKISSKYNPLILKFIPLVK